MAVVGVFIILSILGIILPGVAKKTAVANGQEAYDQALQMYNDDNRVMQLQQLYFLPSYLDGLDQKQLQAYDLITLSGNTLADAKKPRLSLDESISLANLAKKQATDAHAIVVNVKASLDENERLRSTAQASLEQLTAQYGVANTLLGQVSGRYNNEKDQWLSKYMGPIGEKLSSATGSLKSASDNIALAQVNLPALDSTSHTGDPKTAQVQLDTAKIQIDSINSLMSEVTAGLDYQKEAKAQAAPTISKANSGVPLAIGHINDIVRTRGYTLDKALATANSLSTQAENELAQAQLIMTTPLEGGKLDYPAAYELAKSSVEHANQAYVEVDRQTRLEDSARTKLSLYASALATANTAVSQANISYGILSANHAYDTYSDVSGYIDTANTYLSEAESVKASALQAVDIRQQRFEEADRLAGDALSKLSQVKEYADTVTSRAVSLEIARGDWPGKRNTASSIIESERSEVSNYGSYSSSAKSDFNSAVDYYNQALDDAETAHYQAACDNADTAANLASGTGSKAHRAYDDYQAEQERQRQAEEEARQRAIDEANQPSSSDFGSDGGGSSSCCDSGGSSDFGGDGGDVGGGDTGGDGGDW